MMNPCCQFSRYMTGGATKLESVLPITALREQLGLLNCEDLSLKPWLWIGFIVLTQRDQIVASHNQSQSPYKTIMVRLFGILWLLVSQLVSPNSSFEPFGKTFILRYSTSLILYSQSFGQPTSFILTLDIEDDEDIEEDSSTSYHSFQNPQANIGTQVDLTHNQLVMLEKRCKGLQLQV